jgi:hypothetical protein
MKAIDYPVKAHNIIVMGRPQPYVRSFVVRPLQDGTYVLLLWPKYSINSNKISLIELSFPDLRGAPIKSDFVIPKKLREEKEWQWKLVRLPEHMQQHTAPTPTIKHLEIHESNINPYGSYIVLGKNQIQVNLSDLLFSYEEAAKGQFFLDESIANHSHQFIVWSCNQPFETSKSGKLLLNKHSNAIFDWYRKQVNQIKPDCIWLLGDSAYSDGTGGSDFISRYYSKINSANLQEKRYELAMQYRDMYRGHWSFKGLQETMRNYPHYCMWDDHEIRDGYGSEDQDFKQGNKELYKVARQVADEFILNNGPRTRDASHHDAHQSYIQGSVASFIFDGRSSRRYRSVNGQVISKQQLSDFNRFCEYIAHQPNVKYLLMGCGVPFINLIEFIELAGSVLPKKIMDKLQGIRDDLRDSWHSPGNKLGLIKLMGILLKLHTQRPDIEIINLSGDIHVSNAFTFQPKGFRKPLYQITSSALTNRHYPPELLQELVGINDDAESHILGNIQCIWSRVVEPNFLVIKETQGKLTFELKVFQTKDPSLVDTFGPSEKILVVG